MYNYIYIYIYIVYIHTHTRIIRPFVYIPNKLRQAGLESQHDFANERFFFLFLFNILMTLFNTVKLFFSKTKSVQTTFFFQET